MDRNAWNRRYNERGLIWTSEPNRFLVMEVEGLAPGRALDLACGEGRNTVWLAEAGWQATGVDFSEVALEKARRLAEERGVQAEWVAADLLHYRPGQGAFDLVLILYLQVPGVQRQPIVRAAADALARGGTLLLIGHDRSNLEQGYGGPQDPAVLYSAQDIAGDLDGAGLRIERAECVERPVQSPEGERLARDALVRAHRD